MRMMELFKASAELEAIQIKEVEATERQSDTGSRDLGSGAHDAECVPIGIKNRPLD